MKDFYEEQKKKAETALHLIESGFAQRCDLAADVLKSAVATDKEHAAETVVEYLTASLDALHAAQDSVKYYEEKIKEAEE